MIKVHQATFSLQCRSEALYGSVWGVPRVLSRGHVRQVTPIAAKVPVFLTYLMLRRTRFLNAPSGHLHCGRERQTFYSTEGGTSRIMKGPLGVHEGSMKGPLGDGWCSQEVQLIGAIETDQTHSTGEVLTIDSLYLVLLISKPILIKLRTIPLAVRTTNIWYNCASP